MNWIISANSNIYDHENAFKKWGFVDWRQKANYKLGDVVFIYCAAPIQKIVYKCKVTKINMNSSEIVNDEEFWIDKEEFKKSNENLFIRLELLEINNDDALNLENLLNNGLSIAPRRPVKVSKNLLNYIKRFYKDEYYSDENKLKILYCRIGLMRSYNGIQNDTKPIGGGAYNKENIGHELYNFSNNEGIYYGFVQSKSNSINLKRIDETISDTDEYLEDVLVIWVATKENYGQCIVGWYENATVYKDMQKIPNEVINKRVKSDGSEYDDYLIETNNATLVLENRRNERITGMGESNIWYGDEKTNNQVLDYISNYNKNIQTNIDEINDFKKLDGKEREAIVKVRENQSFFRQMLLKKYGSCCLCHISNAKMLIASHIKPWAQSNSQEKLNQHNGLLLCPNHDKAFDGGYITFNDEGEIIISEQLSAIDCTLLNIRNDMKINVNSDNIDFIKFHRENIFNKNK